jgi:hypothetical protein
MSFPQVGSEVDGRQQAGWWKSGSKLPHSKASHPRQKEACFAGWRDLPRQAIVSSW